MQITGLLRIRVWEGRGKGARQEAGSQPAGRGLGLGVFAAIGAVIVALLAYEALQAGHAPPAAVSAPAAHP